MAALRGVPRLSAVEEAGWTASRRGTGRDSRAQTPTAPRNACAPRLPGRAPPGFAKFLGVVLLGGLTALVEVVRKLPQPCDQPIMRVTDLGRRLDFVETVCGVPKLVLDPLDPSGDLSGSGLRCRAELRQLAVEELDGRLQLAFVAGFVSGRACFSLPQPATMSPAAATSRAALTSRAGRSGRAASRLPCRCARRPRRRARARSLAASPSAGCRPGRSPTSCSS